MCKTKRKVVSDTHVHVKASLKSPVPQLEGIKLLGAVGPVLPVLLRLLLRVLSEVVLQRERLSHRSETKLPMM